MRGHGDSAWSPEGAYLVQDYVKDLEGAGRAAAPPAASRCSATPPAAASRRSSRASIPISSSGWSSRTSGPSGRRTSPTRSRARVEQEANGWASEDELVQQLAAANRRTPEPLLAHVRAFRPQAASRRASRVEARSESREGLRRDGAVGLGVEDQRAGALRHRRRQPHRPARDAAAAQRHAPQLPHRRHAGPGPLSDEEDTAGFHENRWSLPWWSCCWKPRLCKITGKTFFNSPQPGAPARAGAAPRVPPGANRRKVEESGHQGHDRRADGVHHEDDARAACRPTSSRRRSAASSTASA